MTWFKNLTGFQEENPAQVRKLIEIDGVFLTSKVNGNRFRCGTLDIPSLAELRLRTASLVDTGKELKVCEVVGDVLKFHQVADNNGALFQVASQFNLLEMVHPGVTPEQGVAIYEKDFTQGPACAIACGAATIYRNYFVEVDGQIGQSSDRQIDCLADLGEALGNQNNVLWTMENGYASPGAQGLQAINEILNDLDEGGRDALRSKLRVGVQSGLQLLQVIVITW